MSLAQSECWLTGSTLSPINLTPRLSNSGLRRASTPSSVVQTGVKSFGWENNRAQSLPIQSWNWIRPSVVSASKSGAIAPIWWSVMFHPHVIYDEYKPPRGGTEPSRQEDKILLPVAGPSACYFEPASLSPKSPIASTPPNAPIVPLACPTRRRPGCEI